MWGGAKVISVNGYYDGHNYITEDDVAVRPNQRVIITFLDEDFDAGSMKAFRECQIQGDWLLVYLKQESVLTLTLVDTGTHSDLFGK